MRDRSAEGREGGSNPPPAATDTTPPAQRGGRRCVMDDLETELPDLDGMTLEEALAAAASSPNAQAALQRVTIEENQRQNVVAGFQSAI